MRWDSPIEFFNMGGYALYVWGSFGVCALAFLLEQWSIRARLHNGLRSLKWQQLAEDLDRNQA